MDDRQATMASWAYALGEPEFVASIKTSPADFRVDEMMPFEASGSGEHVWLHIQKERLNTDQVAKQIARLANVAYREVSYSGLKDYMAITSQWFSVGLAGKEEPDWSQLESENLSVLETHRHLKKLRRGTHSHNQFQIFLRGAHGDKEEFLSRADSVFNSGVPNYFGEQRFGRAANNINHAKKLFNGERVKDRHLRGLLISSARSWLFNQCLSDRIKENTWLTLSSGEPAILAGSSSYFNAERNSLEKERLEKGDIHPSSPLWGKFQARDVEAFEELHAAEKKSCDAEPGFAIALEQLGAKYTRRANRCRPTEFSVDVEGDSILLKFTLEKGQFATSVLREIAKT